MSDVVVFPGRMFGPAAPLLMYSADVAEARGAKVHRHYWSGEVPAPDVPEIEDWVRAQATPLLDFVGGTPLVIAKSLGTNTVGLAAERSLPAIWLTPLLNYPWVVAGLERATAPFLLVGGTGDRSWDSDIARRLTPHVFEVPDADHGMYVPGPLTDSIAVLGEMVTAVEQFLDAIAWTA